MQQEGDALRRARLAARDDLLCDRVGAVLLVVAAKLHAAGLLRRRRQRSRERVLALGAVEVAVEVCGRHRALVHAVEPLLEGGDGDGDLGLLRRVILGGRAYRRGRAVPVQDRQHEDVSATAPWPKL
eukprot:2276202-Prymnesium_polylepis.1